MEDAEDIQNREAFGFVQALAKELAAGEVQLPSYPESVLRMQRALAGEEIDPAIVVKAISTEPALALRVMRMANSVLLNPMGRQVLDLRTAVSRIGYNMVRTAGVTFVVEQLRKAEQLRDMRPQLATLWREGVEVAAFAHVIARGHSRVHPDVALLAGLLHGVGKLYIQTRLKDHPKLQAYPAVCERILREWHAGVARAVLDDWGIPEEVGDAVQEFENLDREPRGAIALSEVLTTATLFARFRTGLDGEPAVPQDLDAFILSNSRWCQRLTIDAAAGLRIQREATAEIEALHSVLDS
jgi:HD-like signal output (HDOD) protein